MVDRVANFQAQEIVLGDQTVTIQGHVARQHLPADFQPSPWTVICGRGKVAFSHVGNQRLRVLVDTNLPAYTAAKSKYEKTLIVSNICDTIRAAAQEGAFVKLDTKTKRYMETGDAAAREKVGQLFREAIAKMNPEKLQKRKEARKAKALKKKALARAKVASSSGSVSTEETASMSTDSDSIGNSNSSTTQMKSVDSLESINRAPMQNAPRKSFIFEGLQSLQNIQWV